MTRFVVGSHDDLMKIRFAWSPVWETEAAVRLLVDERARPYHAPWYASVTGRAAKLDLEPLLAVLPQAGFTPDFLTPPPRVSAPTVHEQLDDIRSTPLSQVKTELERCRDATADPDLRRVLEAQILDPLSSRDRIAATIHRAWRELVAPFWPRIRGLLDADIAHRSRLLTDHGLRRVLKDLDPRIRWSDGRIDIGDPGNAIVELAGTGLVLMPSAFVWPQVVAITDKPWQPTIIYPARGIEGLWQASPQASDALAQLIGRTRALVLVALDTPSSTTALAALTGLSPSGVSRHVISLRNAGLVSATRHRHEVRYGRTPLGLAVMNGISTGEC